MNLFLLFALIYVPFCNAKMQDELSLEHLLAPCAVLEKGSLFAPGLKTVGALYEPLSMVPSFSIFDWSNSTLRKVCLRAYSDLCYSIPEQYELVEIPTVDIMNASFVFSDSRQMSYESVVTHSSHSSGFLGFGSKSKSTTITTTENLIYMNTYNLSMLSRRFEFYTLRVMTLPSPPLSVDFLQTLEAIKNGGNTRELWNSLFVLGSHVVISANLGGEVYAQDFVQTCVFEQESAQYVTTETCKKYDPMGCFNSHSASSHTTQTVDKKYEMNSISYFSKHGGSDDIPVSDWDVWQLTVKSNPLPIRIELESVCLFVRDASLNAACHEYLTDFIQFANDQKDEEIIDMEKQKPPQPSSCFE